MNNLDILHPIDTALLNYNYYFQSLTEQALFCGLLSDTNIAAFQSELLMLLAEQTDKWSNGKSSSIPLEKAQDILTSIIFVIGLELKSYGTYEQAIEALKIEPLKIHFEKGLKIVQRKMTISRHRQKQIVTHLLDTPNVYYRSTIIDGINGFFKLYRPQFSAHEIHITADYPTYMERPSFRGIEFIEQYLLQIEAENNFCIRFYTQDIHHLLCGITENYCSIPMNLFEPILFSALALALVGRTPKALNLTERDIEYLYQQFSSKADTEIQLCMETALLKLDEEMNLPKLTKDYISLCLPKITRTICNAVDMKTLDKIFVIPVYPEQKPRIILSYGDRMNDRKYQKLVKKILQTDNSEEKIALILNEVHSLADLLDILSDAELYANEFDLLINTLPLPAFAILLSQYPNDDFLDRESEQLLFSALQKRKQRLSTQETQQIEQMINAFDSFEN